MTMKLRKFSAWAYDFLCCWFVAGAIVWNELVWHRLLGKSGQAQSDCAAALGHKFARHAAEAGMPEWFQELLLDVPALLLFVAPPFLLSIAVTRWAWRRWGSSPGRWAFFGRPGASPWMRMGRIALVILALFVLIVAWTVLLVAFLDPI